MFENLLEQPAITERLTHDIQSSTIPSSILFYGPAYSGKMTAALELARTLTCETEEALWNCNCRSCRMQRLMEQPFTLISGGRYFLEEISAAAKLLISKDDLVTRYMFVRNVRKLLKRFDLVLWEGDMAKLKKCQTLISSLSEKIGQFLPGEELPAEKKKLKLIDSILNDSKKLSSSVPNSTPINQIRRIATWAHRGGDKKVVILENADRMQEGARNALLKILEEPPENLHFILITTRIGAILPTIKSRVRSYGFSGRNSSQSQVVLKRIFREESDSYISLREFFLSMRETGYEELCKNVEHFILSVDDKKSLFNDAVPVKLEKEMFFPFLEELTIQLNRKLKESLIDGTNTSIFCKINKWNNIIRDFSLKFEVMNQNHTLLLESLFYEMKGYE